MDSRMIESMERNIVRDFLEAEKDIPLTTLVEYILQCYPDSCFSYNYKNGRDKIWKSLDDIIEQAYELFRYEILKWCGCGDVEGSNNVVMHFLQVCNCDENSKRYETMEEYFGTTSIYDNILLLCLAYTMDAAELTEHGSGIGYAWLTDKGKIFLWVLEKVTRISDYTNNN